MMHDWMGWHDGMGWGGGIMMILFWGLVILGVVFLVRIAMNAGRGSPGRGPESPLDILKKRYARGEIDRETYERMKREIG